MSDIFREATTAEKTLWTIVDASYTNSGKAHEADALRFPNVALRSHLINAAGG